jgi:hypothetical protein
MNHSLKCLNCDQEVSGNYCYNCGQKTSTHRINFKHFIAHDFLHGLFHIEKGMLFTAKESLFRPGKAAIDYIDGKRIRYYNVFYFILILIGLNLFLASLHVQLTEIYFKNTIKYIKDSSGNKIEPFLTNNAKILIFSFVPLFAINSFIIFRKRNLNFSEHSIIAGITFLGILLFSTFSSIISFLDFTEYFDNIGTIFTIITSISIFVFPIISYYQTFKGYYKKSYFSIKIFLFILLTFIELYLFFYFVSGYLSNWKPVTVSVSI